ncbi:hypothetical protein C0991_006929, partial [Blastosporella zonata]
DIVMHSSSYQAGDVTVELSNNLENLHISSPPNRRGGSLNQPGPEVDSPTKNRGSGHVSSLPSRRNRSTSSSTRSES